MFRDPSTQMIGCVEAMLDVAGRSGVRRFDRKSDVSCCESELYIYKLEPDVSGWSIAGHTTFYPWWVPL